MNFNETISSRITKARKAKGITIKELSIRTGILGAARISNWEQGTRNPGPEEAKLLAKHLNVAASWLLCLTNNPQGEWISHDGNDMQSIPVLSMKDAPHVNELLSAHDGDFFPKIIVDRYNPSISNQFLFAVKVEDNSMQPDFNEGNIVIVDPGLSPKPGDFVLCYQPSKKQTVLRTYCEGEGCLFQLLASNKLWSTWNILQETEVSIIGIIVESRRYGRA